MLATLTEVDIGTLHGEERRRWLRAAQGIGEQRHTLGALGPQGVVAEAVEVGVPADGVTRAVVALPLVLPLQCHGGIAEVIETKLLAARRKRRHHNYGG